MPSLIPSPLTPRYPRLALTSLVFGGASLVYALTVETLLLTGARAQAGVAGIALELMEWPVIVAALTLCVTATALCRPRRRAASGLLMAGLALIAHLALGYALALALS